ncbi:hypothetical protein [Sphaerisporangium dianthi]|uniref:DUF2207 domain-containing protein n=1 Tax=Sphaerisporangium dianthi TaxID=1436120 RepID=A0ABV9CLX5_9ACTN
MTEHATHVTAAPVEPHGRWRLVKASEGLAAKFDAAALALDELAETRRGDALRQRRPRPELRMPRGPAAWRYLALLVLFSAILVPASAGIAGALIPGPAAALPGLLLCAALMATGARVAATMRPSPVRPAVRRGRATPGAEDVSLVRQGLLRVGRAHRGARGRVGGEAVVAVIAHCACVLVCAGWVLVWCRLAGAGAIVATALGVAVLAAGVALLGARLDLAAPARSWPAGRTDRPGGGLSRAAPWPAPGRRHRVAREGARARMRAHRNLWNDIARQCGLHLAPAGDEDTAAGRALLTALLAEGYQDGGLVWRRRVESGVRGPLSIALLNLVRYHPDQLDRRLRRISPDDLGEQKGHRTAGERDKEKQHTPADQTVFPVHDGA